MEGNKITNEMAEEEFNSWCELNGVDCDESLMSEEDRDAFKPLKNKIIKAIKDGRAVIDGEKIEYTLSDKYEGKMAGLKIVVDSPTAKLFMGTDGYKETQHIRRMQGAMSALTGLDIGDFAKMNIPDWKFFQAVCVLFMNA